MVHSHNNSFSTQLLKFIGSHQINFIEQIDARGYSTGEWKYKHFCVIEKKPSLTWKTKSYPIRNKEWMRVESHPYHVRSYQNADGSTNDSILIPIAVLR